MSSSDRLVLLYWEPDGDRFVYIVEVVTAGGVTERRIRFERLADAKERRDEINTEIATEMAGKALGVKHETRF